MRVAVFSGINPEHQRPRHVREAVEVAVRNTVDLFVLPGWSMLNGRCSPGTYIRLVKGRLNILAETDYRMDMTSKKADSACRSATFLFTKKGRCLGPMIQLFKDSKEAGNRRVVEELILSFAHEDAPNARIVRLDGHNHRIGVLLCGENNVLKNAQAKGNKVSPRHKDLDLPLDTYDVLLNPCHTRMGNWGKLHKRFAHLSRNGRAVIMCTNGGRALTKSCICAYRDGQQWLHGDADITGDNYNIHVTDAWQLAIFDI